MIDKEKRELKDGVISIFKRFNILDHTATIGGLRDDILRYIDSLQKEPVSEKKCMFTKEEFTEEDRKILCEDCEEECEYAKKEEPVCKVWHDMKEDAEDGRNIIIIDPKDFYGAVLRKGGSQLKNHNKERYLKWAYIDDIINVIKKKEEPVSIWHDASEKPKRDDLLIETNDGRIIHRQSINNYGMVKRWAYTSVLLNLDNLCNLGNNSQEEPVSGLDNGDMPVERWKQAVKAASNQRNYRSSKGLTETRDDYFVDGVQWADENPKEEPVSEDLEEAGKQYLERSNPDRIHQITNAFKAGAQWQKEQDQSTIELAEDHAMLAGMEKMKEEMMEKAVDATIGLPYENKDGGYTHLIDVSRPLPVGNNKIAIIFKED